MLSLSQSLVQLSALKAHLSNIAVSTLTPFHGKYSIKFAGITTTINSA